MIKNILNNKIDKDQEIELLFISKCRVPDLVV